MTKFLNISTDTTLGGDSPSDALVVSQKAIAAVLATKQPTLVSGTNIKTVNGVSLLGSGNITISSSVSWGYIGGTLADQTDLKNALDGKQATISDLSTIRSGASAGATAVQPGDLATVATTGSYTDLSNKPTIPAAQVNSDWNATSGKAQILNKPTLATVATSGSYNDLSNKPTIPTVTPPDNSTIVTASSKLQAVALKNQNTASGATTPIPQWVGTIDQYTSQSVATSHPTWLCFITNKTQSALSHYLVAAQYPNSSNGYAWYFKYSDGWVEQGRFIDGGTWSSYVLTDTLPVPMQDANYTAMTSPLGATEDTYITYVNTKTTTTISIRRRGGGTGCFWMVMGKAAS